MNKEKIKELFELCLRVSNETDKQIAFNYSANSDLSSLHLFIFRDGLFAKHFTICQFYELESTKHDFENAKECLLEMLAEGRCPLNES